ncbi:cardiolipin synthase [Nocardioides jishulii]|uniref:cardiolipin synthase n=1 Tax=Nocardioides jishulii TaxID=2575440 RepID=UPI001EF04B7E|nr:cardiolipin synthase [Nocardioides jishulii]
MDYSDASLVAAVAGAVVVAISISMRVAALGIIPGNRRPSTGMAWLLLVLLNPMVGFIGFLFFGSNQVGRKRHRRLEEITARIREGTRDLPPPASVGSFSPAVRSAVTLNRTLGALPLHDDNDVLLLPDYGAAIGTMTQAVREARETVHVEFYIMALDEVTRPFLDALVEATERGVTVRLLFDHLGSRRIPGYRGLLSYLRSSRIHWRPMLPIKPLRGAFRRPDLRNHRKLLVVDGEIGFTGSLNLTEPGYNKPRNHRLGREWVELMVRVEGPIVASLEVVFAGDWWLETDEELQVVGHRPTGRAPESLHQVPCHLVPSGPGYPSENNLRLFTTLIYAAQHRLSITSPYFVPDESLLYAVTTAAQRGVEVELFVSEQSDQFMVGHAQASYYRALLEAGVRIHRYPAPYVLHAKHFTVDEEVAVVGSSNMDQRSFSLNYELSLMMVHPGVVAAVREVEDTYRALSKELTLDEWDRRSVGAKYVDNVMRLTSALQ